MRKFAAAGLFLLVAAFGAAACSSESDEAEASAGTGGTDPDPCRGSMECTCEDGRIGQAPCIRDESNTCTCSSVCDCSACPAWQLDPMPAFDACGGDPSGVWRSVLFAPEGVHLSNLGESGGECPMDLTMAPPSVEFLMNFGDSGDFEIYRSAFSIDGHVLQSCTKEVFERTFCNDLDIQNQGRCLSGACGVCSCTLPVVELEGTGAWYQGTTFVSLTLNSGDRGTPEHCVQGDRLAINEGSGIRFEFERINVMGTPTPCAQRSSETCESSSGCSWDGSRCSGAVTAACALKDYGKIPGCEIVP
jgi:hypothetical protein